MKITPTITNNLKLNSSIVIAETVNIIPNTINIDPTIILVLFIIQITLLFFSPIHDINDDIIFWSYEG